MYHDSMSLRNTMLTSMLRCTIILCNTRKGKLLPIEQQYTIGKTYLHFTLNMKKLHFKIYEY